MKYLPFDLEVALKHPERVVSSDGHRIEEIHLFKNIFNNYPLCVVFKGEEGFYYYKENGRFDEEEYTKLDLFLLPEYKEKFVNVYLDEDGELYVGNAAHDTLSNAKEVAKYSVKSTYIKTIKITSLPYEPNCCK